MDLTFFEFGLQFAFVLFSTSRSPGWLFLWFVWQSLLLLLVSSGCI